MVSAKLCAVTELPSAVIFRIYAYAMEHGFAGTFGTSIKVPHGGY
jgi:hypothetical protein